MIKKNNIKKEKGFTLLELLVVIALMGIIYAVTLSNYNGMNKFIELKNMAYSLALSVRETQVYGINKKLDSGEFSDENPYPFGLHLDTSKKTEIIIFRDKDPINSKFDGDCSVNTIECERKIKFNGGNFISKIKVVNGGVWDNFNGKLNIMFKRPNPDARIVNDSNSSSIYSRINIELSSKDGIYKYCVDIGSAGDVSLKKSCN